MAGTPEMEAAGKIAIAELEKDRILENGSAMDLAEWIAMYKQAAGYKNLCQHLVGVVKDNK